MIPASAPVDRCAGDSCEGHSCVVEGEWLVGTCSVVEGKWLVGTNSVGQPGISGIGSEKIEESIADESGVGAFGVQTVTNVEGTVTTEDTTGVVVHTSLFSGPVDFMVNKSVVSSVVSIDTSSVVAKTPVCTGSVASSVVVPFGVIRSWARQTSWITGATVKA